MMRRRGGGGIQSSSSGMNSSSNSNRQYDSRFSNEKLRTIFLTSTVWVLILSLSLYTVIRSYSSPNCSQTNLIKSKIKK
jgi:hypothetical protein